ncbi:hypothetical protein [Pedobacter nototheniae]|uniref:hypothetical protein n=1 Tax=Pedobacter nototheniae TaxID=2488994 RepID=UPI00292FC8E8|nr:hypothetical protein [Pedobacter nototheniae]
MKSILLLSIILFLSIKSFSFFKQDSEKNYKGKIGNYDVYVTLKNNGNSFSGSYFYERKGIEIKLMDGKLENNQLTCFETDYLNNKTAKITGSLKNGIFIGIWKNLTTQKELLVKLRISPIKYKPLPKVITGNYSVTESDNDCKLSIKISYVKGEYVYLLKTTKREKKGKVYFSRMEDGNYITFSGLPGDENQGDLEGAFNDGEIAIQNYGNSMNEYTRLSECGDKYIHLIKRH